MSGPSLHDLRDQEHIAKAALDAARKHLNDCRAREEEASITRIEARAATTVAYARAAKALNAWDAASRKLAEASEPAP